MTHRTRENVNHVHTESHSVSVGTDDAGMPASRFGTLTCRARTMARRAGTLTNPSGLPTRLFPELATLVQMANACGSEIVGRRWTTPHRTRNISELAREDS
jgi:hypothetical protein